MSEKYKMFSNYMHNELGISKDDIKNWIREAVHEVAEDMVKQAFGNFSADTIVKRIIDNNDYCGSVKIKREISDAFARHLGERITITLKE